MTWVRIRESTSGAALSLISKDDLIDDECQGFLAPCMDILWPHLDSLLPVLHLLPYVDGSYVRYLLSILTFFLKPCRQILSGTV